MPSLWLREYEKIARLSKGAPRRCEGGVLISRHDFNALENILYATETRKKIDSGLFRPARWQGKALQVQNYAGVILLPSGLCLEILPKIAASGAESDKERLRAILVKMLRALPDSPFRSFREAGLANGRMPLLEVFINCFLLEVARLVRRGICSDYSPLEENRPVLRGKLLIKEQILRNSARKDLFYTMFDEFLPDRPENRLIKSALLRVLRQSDHAANQRRCRQLADAFENVPCSRSVPDDFAACRRDRNLRHYSTVMAWCRLLLCGNSPLPQSGGLSCTSVLFPMDRLFERYVAVNLRRQLAPGNWSVRSQAGAEHLVDNYEGRKRFALRPDLLFSNGRSKMLADTKWKLITSHKDIQKSDLYQLFAYTEKYLAGETRRCSFLIYPKTDKFNAPLPLFHFRDQASVLYTIPYDLESDYCPLLDQVGGDLASV